MMKSSINTFCIFLLLLFLCVSPLTAACIEGSNTIFIEGIALNIESGDEINRTKKNWNGYVRNEPIRNNAISSFDVDENGIIAIYFHSDEDDSIDVYDSDGTFLYGFSFVSHRGGAKVFWYNSLIHIYDNVNDITVVDSNGNVVTAYLLVDEWKNKQRAREFFDEFNTEKHINDRTYSLTNDSNEFFDFIMNEYEKLVVTDSNSNEVVIYDNNGYVHLMFVFTRLLPILGIFLVHVFIAVKIVKHVKNASKNKTK